MARNMGKHKKYAGTARKVESFPLITYAHSMYRAEQ